MNRLATIGVVLLTAFVFGWSLSLVQLLDILQPLIVALSIMAAALLVRLNRGMPALDWKSLDSTERKTLTQKIVELTREYIVVLSVHAITLVSLLVLAADKKRVFTSVPQEAILATVGGLIGLCAVRMAYIVWRDYDIVCLQKKLIDESADREAAENASKEAIAKITAIQAAGLRS